MPKKEVECRKIEKAFRNATKVFDDSVVQLLIYHLEEKYGCISALHHALPLKK